MWLHFNMFARPPKERLPRILEHPCLVPWPMVCPWPKLEFIFSEGVRKWRERWNNPSPQLEGAGVPSLTQPASHPLPLQTQRPALHSLHCGLIFLSPSPLVSIWVPLSTAGIPGGGDYKLHLLPVSNLTLGISRKGDTHLQELTDGKILRPHYIQSHTHNITLTICQALF